MNKSYEINGETIYVENENLVVDSVYYDSVDILMGRKPREIHDRTIFTRDQIEERIAQLDESWRDARCFCKWDQVEYIEDEIKRFNTYLNILDDIMIIKEEREVCFEDETFKTNCAIISKEDCVKIDKILSNSRNTLDRLKRVLNGVPHIVLCEDSEDAYQIFKTLRGLDYHDECNQTYCNVDLYENMIRTEYGDY